MAVNLIEFQFPGIPDVGCVFQFKSSPPDLSVASMSGNISWLAQDEPANVRDSRAQLLSRLQGQGMQSLCECRQVHGVRVLMEPEPLAGAGSNTAAPEADGMATSEPGRGLMIKTADCQPLLIAHNSGKHILALHVGWRGNRHNFPGIGVKFFCGRLNLSPADLVAVRGPSLGPAHAQFVNFESEWGGDFEEWFDQSSRCMNLWELTKSQLVEAGLRPENIHGIDICTYANADMFFSYRKNRHTGRQASIIWIR